MRASVIVPTFNGAHKILPLLEGLLKQTIFDFEVIVVIDGSTDNTMDVIEPYRKLFKNFLTISHRNSGRAFTRNRGAMQASADILIFYDDDVSPLPESIAKHLNFHLSERNSLLGGNAIEIYSKTNADIQNYKALLSKKWLSKYPSGISQLNINDLFFTSANCSMPKHIFFDLGGFDEILTDGEDYDLAFRALKLEFPVFFDKNNEAIHREKITCQSYIKRVRQYSFAKKKWGNTNSGNIVMSQKRIRYWLFAHRYWVKAIDSDLFFFLPAILRYKLYDVVIQALAIEFPQKKLK